MAARVADDDRGHLAAAADRRSANVFHAYLAPEQIAGGGARPSRRHLRARRAALRDGDRPSRVQRRNAGADRGGDHRPRTGASAQPESRDCRPALGRIIVRALAKNPERALSDAPASCSRICGARGDAAVLLGRLPPRLRSRPSLIAAGRRRRSLVAAAALGARRRRAAGGWWAPRHGAQHGARQPHRQRHRAIPTSTARCAKRSPSIWRSRRISTSCPTSASAARCS